MSRLEFDDWIVEKYNKEEIPYNPKNWEKLATALNKQNKQKRKVVPIWNIKSLSIAASVAALVVCAFLLINKKDNQTKINDENNFANNITITPISDNKNTTNINTPSDEIITATNNTNNNIIAANKSTTHLARTTNKYTQNNTGNKVNNTNIIPNKNDNLFVENTKQENTSILQQQTTKNPNINNDINTQIRYAKENNNNKNENTTNNHSQNIVPNPYTSLDEPYRVAKSTTSVGVGAGVNYGNMNTGYALGLSAKKLFGSNIYIDGTVNVAINNNTPNVVAVNNMNNVAARPSANQTHIKSPAMANQTQQLYYVQFNPSVGYVLDELVSVSIGSDFQQLVNGEKGKESVIYNDKSGNSELVPKMDLGFTAKTEFSITDNINASVIYREGINNLINSNNSGINYLNRRYVQVMFKYNLNFR